jgi:hypothetical protein
MSEEKKKELKDKMMYHAMIDPDDYFGNVKLIEEILSETVTLPSISDWIEVCSTTDSIFFREKFPNGVIIKP